MGKEEGTLHSIPAISSIFGWKHVTGILIPWWSLRKKITPALTFLELLNGFNVLLDLFFNRKHRTLCMEQICADNIFIQSWPWSCSMIRQKASWFPDVACRNPVSYTDSRSTALFSTFFSIELPTKAPLCCQCKSSKFSAHPQVEMNDRFPSLIVIESQGCSSVHRREALWNSSHAHKWCSSKKFPHSALEVLF